ncbi:unnamed protein product, partial [Onchocerca ochengi]
ELPCALYSVEVAVHSAEKQCPVSIGSCKQHLLRMVCFFCLVSQYLNRVYSLDWSDLQSSRNYEKYTQYSRTKLMIHLMTFKLARLFSGSGVMCNVLEPGVIETKLLRYKATKLSLEN